MDYVNGENYLFEDFTVCGETHSKGKITSNPRSFYYKSKTTGKRATGLSIRVKQVVGMGKITYLEVSLYGAAFKDAKALDLTKGNRISFFGRFGITKGRTQDFKNVSINDPLQIERFHARKAKPSEI